MLRTISSLMILLILMDCGGQYFLFRFVQEHVRKEIRTRIRKGLHHEDMEVFTFSNNQYFNLKWIKPGKEFGLNGNLYDVVTVSVHQGHRHMTCINDTFEKKLVNWNLKNNPWQKHIVKLVKVSSYTSDIVQYKWEFPFTVMPYRSEQLITQSVFYIPSAPPPEYNTI